MTRWGLLSTARINRRIVAAARESDEIELAAVASRERARAQEYAHANGIERAYGSYAELLADEDLEAVYVPLPNSMHVEWSVHALEAGKHVLCEKPLAARRGGGGACLRSGRAGGPPSGGGVHVPAQPADGAPEGARRRGRRGTCAPRPRRLQLPRPGRAEHPSPRRPRRRCAHRRRLLLRQRRAASLRRAGRRLGRGGHGPTGVDEVLAGVLRFPGDVLAQLHCALVLPFQDELEVIGEDGSLFVDDPWLCWSPGIELRRGEEVERIPVEPADSYRLELERFGAAIRGEARPLLGRDESVAQARVLEALHRAAAEGVPVRPG